MHTLEIALRNAIRSSLKCLSKLPPRLATPILSSLGDIPHWIAGNRDMVAATTYWTNPLSDPVEQYSSSQVVGILLQGPIADTKSLTQLAATIKIYNHLFPLSPIVVSTWESSRALLEGYSFSEQTCFVFSTDPGPSFPSNINRQAVSTSAGLEVFTRMGVEFTLKSRVDHRVNSPKALSYLLALWNLFPNPNRIVSSSYGSGKFRLFGWTEQLQFGQTAALRAYWQGQPSANVHSTDISNDAEKHLAELALAVHESRLNVRYLERLDFQVKWDWQSHLQAFTDVFGIADSCELRHVQLGRERTVLDHVYPWNDDSTNAYEQHASFADWLLVKQGLEPVFKPSHELLKIAMKVPVGDQTHLQSLLVKSWRNESP